MPASEHFDVVLLGSGQGGKLLAWHLGRSGKRVAVVERRWVGGSCPAVACLPSKNVLWSAKIRHIVQTADHFGVLAHDVSTDMQRVRERKQQMIDRENEFHVSAYKDAGVELIMGTGRFVGPKTIEVAALDGRSRTLSGDEVVINVGSHAAVPPIPGLAAANPLTHIEMLEVNYLPRHLIILGGGYVGIEFAQAYRRFGSQVTIIEPGARIMGREDPDIARSMAGILSDEGIEIHTDAKPTRVSGSSGQAVTVSVATPAGEVSIEGSDLLIATGRVANTDNIGLEEAGVELDERGFIKTDPRLQTTAPGVWAIGECAGSPQFTHVSVDDFRIVRDNMEGGNRRTDDRLVPHVMYTDPPLAHVGLNESEAARQDIAVRVATLPMSKVLRGQATDETRGFMKALVAAGDDRILGFTMIGSESSEVMAIIQTAMLAELPYTKLRDAVIAHLSVAEGLGPLFGNVPAREATV